METDRRIEDGDVDPLAVEVDEARGGVEAAGARGVSREGALGAERQEERIAHRDLIADHLARVAMLVERRSRRSAAVRLLHVLGPHGGRLGHVAVGVDDRKASVRHARAVGARRRRVNG